jgi:serine/threonine protein kinase
MASAIDQSRYELLTKIASGGMGTVYVGRRRGAGGFKRLVAIKRAHPHLLEDASFARLLTKEAELASAINHPNAISVVDVELLDDELLLIMDYVQGASLSQLINELDPGTRPMPVDVAVRIVLDACAGLHACHTATDDDGEDLMLVHRDVSPQNVLVGADGQARLTDFGIAKSMLSDDKLTATGSVRGKTGYMAPEYASEGRLDRRSDIFGMGVVLWEAIAGKRLFRGATELETLKLITESDAPLLSKAAPWAGSALDDVVATALRRDPEARFASADALANALEHAARDAGLVARHKAVADLIAELFGDELRSRRAKVETFEAHTGALTAEMTGDIAPTEASGESSTLQASNLVTMTRPPMSKPLTGYVVAGVMGVAVIAAAALLMRDDTSQPINASEPNATAVETSEPATPTPPPEPSAVATVEPTAQPTAEVVSKPKVPVATKPEPVHAPAQPKSPTPVAKPKPTAAPDPYKKGRKAAGDPYK